MIKWLKAHEEKSIIILFSLAIVFSIAALLYFRPPFFNEWIIKLESDAYDRQVRKYHQPLSDHPSVAIVAIDDQSLDKEGRWPWDRTKIANLTTELSRLGAKVIVFDSVFSELQQNPVDTLLHQIDNPTLVQELEKIQPNFDSDGKLANALENATVVLGFAFASNRQDTGILPAPLFELSATGAKESLIPDMSSYIGNQPLFQQAAKNSGFINTLVDSDGILRFSPLLMRQNQKVYPSLALEGTKQFLSLPISGINVSKSGDEEIIQSIKLGKITIPTDPWGRILIPFRGAPFSFPYLSATDILQKKLNPESVKDKLVFIGLTATASSDFVATAISPLMAGVEVQASIACGIIDGYLPYKPHWGRATAVLMVLIMGILAAFSFPYMKRLTAFFVSVFVLIAMEAINYWMWVKYSMALSFFFPAPTIFIIFIFDLINEYIIDIQQKNEIKRIFGQFMPSNYLEELFQKKDQYTLTGESKELTIFFGHICDFPNLIDPFSLDELKEFLRKYFTLINETIFENKGIVDNLNRDEIIAIWGAPLPQAQHAYSAVKTALTIQEKLASFKPPIEIGIGINTGIVHIGDMGSKYSRNYTAIGRPVDLALHLKELTKAHLVPILVGEATYQQTKDLFHYRQVDEIEVNGKKEKIYEPKLKASV